MKTSLRWSNGRSLGFQARLLFHRHLGGCDAGPECDSIETRSAVLKLVSDDHSKPLATFAARNSDANKDGANNTASEANKSVGSDGAKPLYLLGQKMVTASTGEDKRTLQCRRESGDRDRSLNSGWPLGPIIAIWRVSFGCSSLRHFWEQPNRLPSWSESGHRSSPAKSQDRARFQRCVLPTAAVDAGSIRS
jgi:hypothetical protein